MLLFTVLFGDSFLVRLIFFLLFLLLYTRIFVDGLLVKYDVAQGFSRLNWLKLFGDLCISKICSLGILISIVVTCNGQFLTPDQLREQHDLGYAGRTHYDTSGGRLTDIFRRINPDYLLRGYF